MQWIRKHIYWIAGTAVAGMLLWLVASSAVSVQSVQGESAGTLFGRPVSAADYLKSLQAVTHQAILTHGDHFRQRLSLDELEAQAWERLTFVEEAKRKGIRITDREVVKEIQDLSLFRDSDGQFDERGYNVVMQYTLGTTPRLFEEEIRENLMIQKMVQQVIGTPTAAEEEIRKRFQEREGAIQIEFALFPDAEQAREVADACRAQPDQLEKAAKQAGAKVISTGFFKRDDKVKELDISRVIFSQMAEMKSGEAAGPFKAGTGWAVVRLKDRRPVEEKDFAAARPMLEKEVIAQKRLRNYLAWFQELLKRAKPQKKGNNPSGGQAGQ